MAKGRGPRVPIDLRTPFARRLKAARVARGWSQAQLADELNKAGLRIPQQTIGSYEASKAEPDLAKLSQIARVLGIAARDLAFGGDPEDESELLGPMFERYREDEGFVFALWRTAAMHSEEGLRADLTFSARVARRLLEEAKRGTESIGIRERIEKALATERQQLRAAIDGLKRERS
jgi:transcriptional regulator with XRE-family HTH domain